MTDAEIIQGYETCLVALLTSKIPLSYSCCFFLNNMCNFYKHSLFDYVLPFFCVIKEGFGNLLEMYS